MTDTIIRVENLSKKYVIGHQTQERYSTLRDAIANRARSLTRKLQTPPFGKKIPSPAHSEEFWALKDVLFEIKQGDRVGIIGRNGAGKSTLLKLLSRLTEPTTGRISIKGRVTSLLEVGTGFHPELTGRENIYLNGAVLGMSRIEIKKKFDEIIAFAEVEKFLDTPVKRYSSGMYVRLAFAVAAHLEPEILIVDEVLAVGDVQFQKKCLGKMQDVSKEQGRTVLFVSHNMDAIQRLCSQSIMLEHGKLIDYGNTTSLVVRYMASNNGNNCRVLPNEWIDVSNASRYGTGEAHFIRVKYNSLNEAVEFHPYSNGSLDFCLDIVSDASRAISSIAVVLFDQSGTKLINADTIGLGQAITLRKGHNTMKLRIESLYLNPGFYVLGLWLADPHIGLVYDYIKSAFEIEVINLRAEGLGIRPDFDGKVTCQLKLFS